MAEKTMTLGQLYKDYASRGARQKKAATVLNQIDWLTCNAEFDPISGMPTPMPLTKFIFRVARRDVTNDDFPHDRLWHLVDHCSEAVVRLIRNLNENPARDHEFMHIRQVKELDAPSFVKLSTRPGRNIREKLSSNPYLQAVKRYMSVDLAENRLFKAFLRRLYELLELRYEMMKAVRGDTAEAHPLMDEINRWLRSDVADEISDWENTPPNNTLLSHKDYKKVWDAWRWMLTLDEDVNRDYSMNDESEMRRRENLVRFWNEYALAWKRADNVRMAEVPLFFDYDKFEIKVWGDSDVIPLVDNGIRLIEIGDLKASARIGCRGNSGQIRRPKEISDPACVDLTWLSPRYAIDDKIRTLPVRLIWQNWAEKPEDAALAKNANGVAKNVAFSLFGADAIWQHPDTTTIAFADLFAGADCKAPDELQWRAAHASAEELNRIFTNETIVWLMPDGISEFELKVIRGNLNAAFKNAQPLPRSIAAIYEKVDFTMLPRKLIQMRGYGVLVLDTTDDGVLATKMTAKYSKELEKKVPSTLGYYWERNPSVLLTNETVRQSALSEIKSKGPFCWRQANPGEADCAPWLNFLGSQIRFDGETRIRKESIEKHIRALGRETAKAVREIESGNLRTGAASRWFCRFRNRLIAKGVGYVTAKVEDCRMCWAGAFPNVTPCADTKMQMRQLDRAHEGMLSKVWRVLTARFKPGHHRYKGHPYSYFGFLKKAVRPTNMSGRRIGALLYSEL